MVKLSDDLWRRVKDAVKYPFIDERTDRSLLIALHGEVFSSNLCQTCENEQTLAYIELFRLINPKKMSNPPSKNYRFHPSKVGQSLSLKGVRGSVTADTLTDDVAKRLIKSGLYDGFVVTVEEAEKAQKKLKKEPVDYSSLKVAELKAMLDEKGIDYGDAKKPELVKLAEETL